MQLREVVWRHLLSAAYQDDRRRWSSIGELASEVGLGISTVHKALVRPVRIGAVWQLAGGGFALVDPGRLLAIWAVVRDFEQDRIATVTTSCDAYETEAALAGHGVLGGCGAIIARTGRNDISDYDQVVIYAHHLPQMPAGEVTTVHLLRPDERLSGYGSVVPLAQAYTDCFNLPGWGPARFVGELNRRLLTENAVSV